MRHLAFLLGRIIFWLAWPIWFVYFRVASNRTRVFVIADDKILLVRTWLGAATWGLPGGGAKRHEVLDAAACRELREETGVTAQPQQLTSLGSHSRSEHGLRYTSHYFLLKLDKTQSVKGQIHEIAEAKWFTRSEAEQLEINFDTQHGLERYGSQFWYND